MHAAPIRGTRASVPAAQFASVDAQHPMMTPTMLAWAGLFTGVIAAVGGAAAAMLDFYIREHAHHR